MKFVSVFSAIGLFGLVLGCNQPANSSAPLTSDPPRTAQPQASRAPTAGAARDDVIATIDGTPITRQMLTQPLIEAYGLNMLAKVAQLELAKKQATVSKLSVTPADIAAETERYVNSLFNEDKDPVLKRMNESLDAATAANNTQQVASIKEELHRERNRLLEQLLGQQKISRADFNLVMETNTYLRKIGESILKNSITEENLQQAFNQLYGEKVQVKHIAVANLQEATEAKRRIAAGEAFEEVARTMSRNQQSAAVGGELPAFSRTTPGYPDQFKQVAFTLKPGEISDPVAGDGGYHIIKLEQRIAPKVMKFEDVKDSVREYLYERQLESTVKQLRTNLQQAIASNLKISEPELKRQYQQQVLKHDDEIKEKEDYRHELERRRQQIREQSATQPSDDPMGRRPTIPTTAPATTAPATAPH